MANEYAQGHRSRLKEKYKSGGFSHDYELLELLLTYSVPRRDVKPAAKNLLARFGSVEEVLKAEPKLLETAGGIGENSAALIALIAELNGRAFAPDNADETGFDAENPRISFTRSALENYGTGSMAMITLNNAGKPISCTDITEDYRRYSESGNIRPFGNLMLRDSAAGAILALKTDKPSPYPEAATIAFVIKLISFFGDIETKLEDCIIIGTDDAAYSMHASDRYCGYFER